MSDQQSRSHAVRAGKPVVIEETFPLKCSQDEMGRFTEYTTVAGDQVARMLYDHQVDPQEDVNLSEQQGSQATVKRLTGQLHEQMGH